MLDGVKHIYLVLSGKGGVGKSTVSSQLALALKEAGFRVGLLDIDLCGPSIPYLLNLEDKDVHQSDEGYKNINLFYKIQWTVLLNIFLMEIVLVYRWVPVYTDNDQTLAVMSIGFLLKNRNDSVVWRGPKKTSMIRQFLTDVAWQDIDYLIIDTPPGTSDEHITVMENLQTVKCDGAIIVTTPQAVAIDDVIKEITFCKKTGIPIVGIVENMSGFVCPTCSECTNIFSSDGGISLSEITKVPFLTKIPIDPTIGKFADKSQSIMKNFPDSPGAKAFTQLLEQITKSKEA
ncbi:unnamed protein product [Trichogramma brassicae]|uniref:Cytosolic Fe-S cluster assembly factor NUBP2 homolog n=1 Tax=Trichogramma brassicae TaxID=86971 RepID=A0A6H5I4S3_9HYME|nr:unnamed protein product [Trichogramma brassicae]